MLVGNLIARFFYGITEPILAPLRWILDSFYESPRKRALLLGLPAVLIACIGIALIVAARIRRENELLDFYNQASNRVENEIGKQVALVNASRELTKDTGNRLPAGKKESEQSAPEVELSSEELEAPLLKGLSREQKKLVKELLNLQGDQQTLLLKLISLDPVNQSYQFRYANSFATTDPMKQFNLMQQLAPETNPGYGDAHFWLAFNFMRARANTPNEKRLFLEKSLLHSNYCLSLDSGRKEARSIKADALFGLGRQQEAYVELEQLFREDPEHFEALVRINKSMKMESRSRGIYEDAANRLLTKLKTVRDTDLDVWTRTLRQIQACFIGSQNFVELRNTLLNEQALAKGDPLKKRAVDEIFGSSLNAEAQLLIHSDNASQRLPEILKMLKAAHQFSPDDIKTKYLIAYVTQIFPEIASEAKEIYDPDRDPDVPSQVLQVMGNAEIQNRNISQAIERYEQARLRNPKDPDLLNNLAYAYLLSDSQNAERALFLVDEALQLASLGIESVEPLSHFYHTRGTALLALERPTEAAASFELALQYRPENPGILESLVKCYTGRDDKQAAAYQRRLDKVLSKTENKLP